MFNVVGAEVKAGTFSKDGKKIDYNNLYLYLVGDDIVSRYDDNGKCVHFAVGKSILPLKLKNNADRLSVIFGCTVDDSFINSLIGNDIDIFYDRFGNVNGIKVI